MCGSVDVGDDVGALLETAIDAFEGALEKANMDYGLHCSLTDSKRFESLLEIDTDGVVNGKPYLKIINNLNQDAFAVSLDTIVQSYRDKTFNALIRALQTGIFDRVYGVTRIVGYFSRVSNWNKSKGTISVNGLVGGELGDRMKGCYNIDDGSSAVARQRINSDLQPALA